MWQDFRYGLRSIRNQAAFTTLAVLTLALGIGAATTIFSVIQNVLLDPFPYKDADRVVAIRIHDAINPQPFGRAVLQTPEFLDYVEQNQVFEDVIGGIAEDVLMTTAEGTELVVGGSVTGKDPIGRQVKVALLETLPDGALPNPLFDIVGVIADVKNSGIQDPARPEPCCPGPRRRWREASWR